MTTLLAGVKQDEFSFKPSSGVSRYSVGLLFDFVNELKPTNPLFKLSLSSKAGIYSSTTDLLDRVRCSYSGPQSSERVPYSLESGSPCRSTHRQNRRRDLPYLTLIHQISAESHHQMLSRYYHLHPYLEIQSSLN